MLNYFRNRLFWTLDLLKGSAVRRHMNDLRNILNRTSEDYERKPKVYLDQILQHAVKTVPYYSKLDSISIEDFPVVNKNVIRDHFDAFKSDSYINKKKRTVTTSGSTGTPFRIDQNIDKVKRNSADNLYLYAKANYKPGERMFYFRLWNAFEHKSRLQRFVQNLIPVDVFDMDDDFIADFLKQINKESAPVMWLGYASAFEKICDYLNRKDPDFRSNKLKCVVAISEHLNDKTKASILKYFGIYATSRYSNSENGIIAQQTGERPYFDINFGSYKVEILREDSDEPVQLGKPGRIVVTDLFNYCMPMIRYDTGDMGVKGEIDGKPVLTEVLGRRIDQITDTKGNKLVFNIVLIINKYPNVRQCQIVQKQNKVYEVRLNVNDAFNRETELIEEYKQYLGDEADMRVSYVKEIPLLDSGKFRVLVNETI